MTGSRGSDGALKGDLALAALSGFGLLLVMGLVFQESAPSASVPPATAAIGKLSAKSNEVRRRPEGTLVWSTLRKGDPVYARDAIYVGADSDASVRLDDGSRIDIEAASLVLLSQAPASGDALHVDLVRGGLSGEAVAREIDVRGGAARARLERGTTADVRIGSDRGARVAVRQGRARVESTKGEATLGEGERQAVSPAGDAVRLAPISIPLRDPAVGARIFVPGKKAPISFEWEPAAGAGDCVLEVAHDPEFKDVVARDSSLEPRTEQSLSPGLYYWRVSCTARVGGAALTSEERRLVLVDDRPPLIYRPGPDTTIDLSARSLLSFAWSEVSGATHYRIELAERDKAPFFTTRTSEPSYLLRTDELSFEEGQYCLRVRVDDPERSASPWSSSCFRVVTRPVLPAPNLLEPTREPAREGGEQGSLFDWLIGSVAYAAEPPASGILLRWERLPGAVEYLVEIASDRAFSAPLLQTRVRETYYRFIPPVPRAYYWRVRGIDASGREGKVSEPRTVGGLAAVEGLSPADGASFEIAGRPPAVALSWTRVDGAARYEVEWGRDAKLTEEIERHSTSELRLELRPARAGDLFWRVVAIAESGVRGAVAPARRIILVTAAPRPSEGEATVIWEAGQATALLRWSKRPASRYTVEIATDQLFTAVVVQQSSSGTSLRVPVAHGRPLYWRVRAEGPAGPWSHAARLAVPPPAPQPLLPEEGARLRGAGKVPAELSWSEVSQAVAYRVQLQAAEQEGSLLEARGASLWVKLAPGSYSWSVRSVDGAGLASPPSAMRRLEVVSVAPPEQKVPVAPSFVPKLRLHDLQAGFSLGLVSSLGEVLAMRFGTELSYRPAVGRGSLGPALRVGYYSDSGDLVGGAARGAVSARLHAVPLELVALFSWPLGQVDVTAALGFGVTVAYASIGVPKRPGFGETHPLINGLLALGAERDIGPGKLFGELLGALGAQGGPVETAASGITCAVGYRLPLAVGETGR